MIAGHLVLAALEAQDSVAIVLASPAPGQPPTMAEANEAFQRLTGLPRDRAAGVPLTFLTRTPLSPEWLGLLDAIGSGQPLHGELPCRTAADVPFWFGFTLTHPRDPLSGRIHPVLVGRDSATERRIRDEQESARALLGSIFMMVDAAVVLVRADGRISMANPAMLSLVGYSAAELTGKLVRELTHPDDIEAAAANHARQLSGGEVYRMRLRTLMKDGTPVPVRLTSALIERSHFEKFRVVTLTLDPEAKPAPSPRVAAGHVETISLKAIQDALGSGWEAASSRLVMVAETIIKRRLGPRDVFARQADAGFSIWFEDADTDIGARVAGMVREIRIRLLGEFGEGGLSSVTGVAAHVTGVLPAGPPSVAGLAEPSAQLRAQQAAMRNRARATIASLSANAPVAVARVTDRNHRPAGFAWADLPRADRQALQSALACLPEDTLATAGSAAHPELLRLQLAVTAMTQETVGDRPLTWLLPISCAALLIRPRRERLLEALRALPAGLRGRLFGLLSDIPADTGEARLRSWFDLLAPLMVEIGVMALAPDLPAGPSLRPPCRLVAIDLEAGSPPAEMEAFELMGSARRLGLPVLVRTTREAEIRDWRELGATLFAVTPG